VISGLWHNPAWTYVIWGAVHALGRVFTRFLELSPFYQNRVPTLAKQLLTFVLVSVAWVFFRAATFSDALLVLRGIFAFQWTTPSCPVLMLVLIFAVWIYQFAHESRFQWCLQLAPVRVGLVVLMVAYLAMFSGSSSPAFIYAQF
jgi:alginate O-acetyltransferase complex protein AlgI